MENISAAPGDEVSIVGTVNDLQGLTSISVVNSNLGLNEVINLSGELSYELNQTFTIPDNTSEGDYSIETTATNIEGLSTTFVTNLLVSNSAGCSDNLTIFADQTLDSNVFFSETDGSFDPYEFSATVTTVLNGDALTLTGDFMDFFEMDLTLTMVPDENDSSFGEALFDIENLGEADDGFTYRLAQVQPGSYNACERTISVVLDVEYEDGGTWVFYYRGEAEFSLP